MSAADAKIIKEEPLDPRDAKWTRLVLTTYTDPLKKTRDWESARRTTRPAGAAIDGVGILALLVTPGTNAPPRLLLQKQFRPPTGKVCIEVPAGLIDAGESAETCALRELKEETGYVGRVIKSDSSSSTLTPVSPIMFNDPGFCDTNLQMVHVEIDTTAPENQPDKLQTQLEENEFIECFSVELGDLYAECVRLDKEGYVIDARVGTLAEGIEVAKRWAGVLGKASA
ncbi:NUDIX hydrolase domain-like protein [Phyllosticta capitalensis]